MVSVVGLADHYGWAAVVVVGPDGSVLDRRRAELIDDGLPASPIHHECQSLPIDEAIALVHDVERSVAQHAAVLWDALAIEHDVTAVAIREIPELPSTIEEQIRSYHAQTRADPAMYRRILADDAARRGWAVRFYDHRRVIDEAVATLGIDEDELAEPRSAFGPPWTVDHRRALAAALMVRRDTTRS
jgi:hypothetical protein